MVMTWLVNSMNEEIDSNYMCYSTTKELWDNDLDMFNVYKWKSTNDANHYKQTVEAHRIYKFLAGLNVEFDEVRGRIIGKVPLPKIKSHRHVTLGNKSNSETVESPALSVAEGFSNKTTSYQRGPGERPRNNKPEEKSNRSNPNANATINELESSPFNKEQMDHLLKLLKSNSSLGIPSAFLTQTGSASNAFSCCFNSTPWIIDSEAFDNMTSFSNLFNTYSPCSGSEKTRIVDGSFSPIAGKGLVKLFENIDLKFVLHVPKLACNLLFNSRKKIGNAKLIDGIYYFDCVFSNKLAQGLSSRKTHQKSQSQPILLGNDQSRPSRTKAPDIRGSPTPNLPSIPFISFLGLDIPIALRKGTRTCTKYPIAKYLSYRKPSKTHKEALDDPNWKVAMTEKMNALKRGGTWELVDLPKEKRTVELEGLKRRLATEFEIKDLGIVSKASWEADLLVTYAFRYCFCNKHGHGHLQVEAFTNADWARSVADRHSTSSYCTFIGGNLVTWRSKKQNVVARSSVEAESRSIALEIYEVLWIRQLLEELKISSTLPMKLYYDNKAAILIAHNLVLHDRTKHVEQVVDMLSKGIPTKQFDRLIGKLAMEDIFKPT
ncbi:hypothetical protein AAG906_006123 [Vitis piasezkii]